MDPETQRQLSTFGRTLVQMNLRLTRIGEILEGGGHAPGAGGMAPDATSDLLFDLLEAVERTAAQPAPARPEPRWIAQLLRLKDPPPCDLTGLALARDHVLQQLARLGIVRIPADGPVDPTLHQVIDVHDADDPARAGTVAVTHRAGWMRAGEPPLILRFAQVTAWRTRERT